MGKIPWLTYDKILSDSIYNMDELGNNTTKHRNKTLQKNNYRYGTSQLKTYLYEDI